MYKRLRHTFCAVTLAMRACSCSAGSSLSSKNTGNRPTSVLLQMFADAKLDEIIAIYSKATTQERQEGYKMLFEIYPAQSTRLEELQKPVR